MTTENVKTLEGMVLPLKPVGKNYVGNPEEALRFVDIKEVLDSLSIGDMFSVKATGYALFKGYHDTINVALFLSDKVALSFSTERTTGKQIDKKLKDVLASIGEENEERLRGAEVIYTFKVLKGLAGNYLAVVKMVFTGVVKEFESKVEVSGIDNVKRPDTPENPKVEVQEATVKTGGVDYAKFLKRKEEETPTADGVKTLLNKKVQH
jgi:hypothetical protein